MGSINSVMKEFKAFIPKGNIIDVAVGIIIGGAFGKIAASLVNNILAPLLGALTGDASFSTPEYIIHPAATINGVEVGETAILYGSFLQDILDFLIIGVCMFFMIRTIAVISSRLRREEDARGEAPAPAGPAQEELLAEIRSLLKERKDIA